MLESEGISPPVSSVDPASCKMAAIHHSSRAFWLSATLGLYNLTCYSFTIPLSSTKAGKSQTYTVCEATRRDALSTMSGFSSLVFLPDLQAAADDDKDMTSQLFNSDGSLKVGEVEEAKQRHVKLKWDLSENALSSVDGVNAAGTNSGSQVALSYQLPEKWSDGKDGNEIYFDRSEGINAKACKRITVFQAPGIVDSKRLQKATTIGVAKALDVPESLNRLYKADIISGRVSNKDGQTYYEFDMAAAPETCGESQENLGLGFCPYDNIFLLSATIVEDRLYCIAVECDSTRIWKIESSDLKRVRSSFTVDAS